MTAVPGPPSLGIGEVLAQLRSDFPDVTVSKIRFLEAEGLVEPSRTPSGYRRFSAADVERLRYVLGAQRERYLPLKVIREHLAAMDGAGQDGRPGSGRDAAAGPPGPGRPGPAPPAPEPAPGAPAADDFRPAAVRVRLTRAELAAEAGVAVPVLEELEAFGLLAAGPGGHFDADALAIARTVGLMARFGIEPRHLRPFRVAADREVGLVRQVVAPLAGQRGVEAPSRAEQAARELAALSVRLHTVLVRAGLHADQRP